MKRFYTPNSLFFVHESICLFGDRSDVADLNQRMKESCFLFK
jgi:hypothetical protein